MLLVDNDAVIVTIMRSQIIKIVFGVILLWFLLLGLLSVLPINNQLNDENHSHLTSETSEILKRIDNALLEIQTLKRNNAEMKKMLSISSPKNLVSGVIGEGNDEKDFDENDVRNAGNPSRRYENTRRQLETDLKELWYILRTHSETLPSQDFEQIQDVYRTLRSNLNKLRASDGYESYRERETEELSRIVVDRIHELQNPKDCDKARKLVCTLNKGCGFGCQVHHVCYCLIVAYATGRTLVLESRGWRYNRQGWEKVFSPVSESCTSPNGESRGDWQSANRNEVQVLQLPIVDFLKPRPPFLPIAIPSDLASRLEKVHGEPHIWWVGQFMKYLLRLQPQTQTMIDEAKTKLGVGSPLVGIHVRRTDKIGTEASFHSLKEYMAHAEEYFDIQRRIHPNLKKRVFIASDDPNVITEALKMYPSPEWEILGDKGVAQSASVSQRYNGLHGIIKDVFLLAECDFVVCTFSSQVCRLAYELIQTKHADSSERFVSLDDVYYYGGGVGLIQKAESAHKPRNNNEIELKEGDKISVAGNHWNGMSKGTNLRTNKVGLYPSYKARNAIPKVDFPHKKWWSSHGDVEMR